MNGIFLINKPKDWTSFDVCAKLRKKFDTKRVGHSGTLDPFAEGLMIVAMGRATKILSFIEDIYKTYVAELKLGESTDTMDLTGSVIRKKDVPELNEEIIINSLNKFLGESMQVPPMFSALKKDGIPLYQLAREGIEEERKKRNIHIYNIRLISYEYPIIKFEATVSRGTYIRVLANDIANDLNTEGHLISLVRTSIGNDKLSDAVSIYDVQEDDITPIHKVLSFMKTIVVDVDTERDIRNGIPLNYELEDEMILFINEKEEALAIYEKRDKLYYCKRGLF